jgi:hypothetical protein
VENCEEELNKFRTFCDILSIRQKFFVEKVVRKAKNNYDFRNISENLARKL